MTDPNRPSSATAPWAGPLLSLAKYALLAIVLGFVGLALGHQFRLIDWSDLTVSWPLLAVAMACLIAVRFSRALVIHQVLASLGVALERRRVVPIMLISFLGRYVPGKFGVVAGAALMLRQQGVRPPIALVALAATAGLTVLAGLIATTPLLSAPAVRDHFAQARVLGPIMIAVGLVCLYPRLFTRLCNVPLWLMRRQLLPTRMALWPFMKGVGLTALTIALVALGLWCTACAVKPVSLAHYPIVIAAVGLATVAGLLAVFTPAGLGVHEGVYFWTLEPIFGHETVLIVLILRLGHMVADALTGGGALVLYRRQERPAEPISDGSGEVANR